MFRRLHLLIAGLLAIPASAFAYGEADLRFEERALHFQTDRVRVDPGATDVTFDTFEPVRPLVWNDELGDAARFYADDMGEHGCFPADHSSCDGTSFQQRLNSFYSGSTYGENIAKGQPSAEYAVFDSWLYSTSGHRENMLNPEWNEFGGGFALDGTTPIWVQDFGFGGVEEPIVTSGTHEPLLARENEEAMRFFAAVYDPDEVDPDMHLVVTNLCVPMDVDRGGSGMTTFVAEADAGPEGCMPYWFLAERDNGEAVSFPTEGSLVVPVGDVECPSWIPQRRTADCVPDGVSGFSGSGAGCSGGGGEDAYPDAVVGQDVEYGTCAQSPTSAPRMWWLGALLLGLGRRRR